MPLDRALTLLFRNFSTCFLLVASLTLPLHVAVSYSHRDVIAVAEIHQDIARFPDDRRVAGVGREELRAYRSSGPIVLLVELALLPVLVGATARIVEQHGVGGIPRIGDAWLHGFFGWRERRLGNLGLPLTGALIAVLIALLARALGLLLSEPLPDAVSWAGRALTEGGSRALAAPFFLVPAALSLAPAKGARGIAPTH